jgi:hypothetical protein
MRKRTSGGQRVDKDLNLKFNGEFYEDLNRLKKHKVMPLRPSRLSQYGQVPPRREFWLFEANFGSGHERLDRREVPASQQDCWINKCVSVGVGVGAHGCGRDVDDS